MNQPGKASKQEDSRMNQYECMSADENLRKQRKERASLFSLILENKQFCLSTFSLLFFSSVWVSCCLTNTNRNRNRNSNIQLSTIPNAQTGTRLVWLDSHAHRQTEESEKCTDMMIIYITASIHSTHIYSYESAVASFYIYNLHVSTDYTFYHHLIISCHVRKKWLNVQYSIFSSSTHAHTHTHTCEQYLDVLRKETADSLISEIRQIQL